MALGRHADRTADAADIDERAALVLHEDHLRLERVMHEATRVQVAERERDVVNPPQREGLGGEPAREALAERSASALEDDEATRDVGFAHRERVRDVPRGQHREASRELPCAIGAEGAEPVREDGAFVVVTDEAHAVGTHARRHEVRLREGLCARAHAPFPLSRSPGRPAGAVSSSSFSIASRR